MDKSQNSLTWIRLRHEKADGGQNGGQSEAGLPVSLKEQAVMTRAGRCGLVDIALNSQETDVVGSIPDCSEVDYSSSAFSDIRG